MPQRAHPLSFLLGGGWFKLRWLKAPGSPARNINRQVTAGSHSSYYQVDHRLVTAVCSLLSTDIVTTSHAVFWKRT
eukprot:5258987-Amphidinium_carterae.1